MKEKKLNRITFGLIYFLYFTINGGLTGTIRGMINGLLGCVCFAGVYSMIRSVKDYKKKEKEGIWHGTRFQ